MFYGTWAGVLQALAGSQLDVIFTSEDYGDPVAQYLQCEHFLVDRGRALYPVSGTMIRNRPQEYLHYLNEEMASYFRGKENSHHWA